MNKDMILMRTVEVAAIAAYKYIGRKDKEAIDRTAVEAFEVMLRDEKYFKLKVINGEGELDKAPMLYVGQILGGKNNPSAPTFDVSVDPIEGTNPAAYNFAGSISVICISRENTMLRLPEMYMEKLFVAKEFKDCFDLSKGIIESAREMQIKAGRKALKCIILDKPRHDKIIKDLSDLGIIVRLIKDGDVLAAIDVINGEADFVYGIGGAPEGSLMASLSISSGAKMQCRLVGYKEVWPNEPETKSRVGIEKAWMSKHQLDFDKVLNDTDLIIDPTTKFFASGITAGGSLKPVDYIDGKFHISTFMSSHGIVRNIRTIYDVEQINSLKPEIKYLFDKYKR